MIIVMLTFLIFIYFLQKIYKIAFETKLDKYHFELFALRDEIRQQAIEGDVDASNWLYNYIESSIAKTCDVLKDLSIYKITLLYLLNRHNKEFQERYELMTTEMNQHHNKQLKMYWRRYREIVGLYMLNKHSELILVRHIPFLSTCTMKNVRKYWKNIQNFTMTSDEVTTLPEFCH